MRLYFLILFMGICPLWAMEWSAGTSLGADGCSLFLGAVAAEKHEIRLELGPAWERQADFRIDDGSLRLEYSYALGKGKIVPFLAGGYEMLFVDTGYSQNCFHGIFIGPGIALEGRNNHSLFLKGGWRSTRGDIHSAYAGDSFEAYYSEEWKAPPFWISFGYRYRWESELKK